MAFLSCPFYLDTNPDNSAFSIEEVWLGLCLGIMLIKLKVSSQSKMIETTYIKLFKLPKRYQRPFCLFHEMLSAEVHVKNFLVTACAQDKHEAVCYCTVYSHFVLFDI